MQSTVQEYNSLSLPVNEPFFWGREGEGKMRVGRIVIDLKFLLSLFVLITLFFSSICNNSILN